MKVKLLKIQGRSFGKDSYDDSSEFTKLAVLNTSNWEEIDETKGEYSTLCSFVRRYNLTRKAQASKEFYVIVTEEDKLIQGCIKDQIEYERLTLEKQQKEEAERERKRIEAKKLRQQKKAAKLFNELQKSKAMYEKVKKMINSDSCKAT